MIAIVIGKTRPRAQCEFLHFWNANLILNGTFIFERIFIHWTLITLLWIRKIWEKKNHELIFLYRYDDENHNSQKNRSESTVLLKSFFQTTCKRFYGNFPFQCMALCLVVRCTIFFHVSIRRINGFLNERLKANAWHSLVNHIDNFIPLSKKRKKNHLKRF